MKNRHFQLRQIHIALFFVMSIYLPIGFADAKEMMSENACGIENCHGIEIRCGFDVPEVCTEIYRLGDFCRQFVRCEEKSGQCVPVQDAAFLPCRECVENCQQESAPQEAFRCENECRKKFE